jgi:predicted CXXCH cytochrome family protein
MHHTLREHGLLADYPVAYSIGYGKVGRSYLVESGNQLFQSPASYYTSRSGWGVSPGYEDETILDFSRSITSDCLSCHAGSIQQSPAETKLTPISCDRCHGPTERHRQQPFPGSIINPAKLPVRERDSVCEQCHLEGATVVLNPGKSWSDFHPGQRLEQVETQYVYETGSDAASIKAVSQAEQLSLSACWRGSKGKLWCGTCHDPHGDPARGTRQLKQLCESCHPDALVASNHTSAQDDCASCHMPRLQSLDIAHAAVTDHRIRKRPSEAGSPVPVVMSMRAWHDPELQFAQRALGLALFQTAKQNRSPKGLLAAYHELSHIPEFQRDAPVSAALGYILLSRGHADDAVECFDGALQQSPRTAEYWLDLAVAQKAAGNPGAAITAFRKSIEQAPRDYRPYLGLSTLYKDIHDTQQDREVLREFLLLTPNSILARLQR